MIKRPASLKKAPIVAEQPSMNRPHTASQYEGIDSIKTYDAGTFDIDPSDINVGHLAGKKLYHHVFKKPDYDHKPGKAPYIHAISVSEDPWNEGGILSSSSVSGGGSKDKAWAPGTPWKDDEGFAQIGESITRHGVRGRGLGTKLYDHILGYHGRLASDTSVSPSAQRVWEKMSQKPGVKTKMGRQGERDVNWAETSNKYQDPINTVGYGGKSPYSIQMEKERSEREARQLREHQEYMKLSPEERMNLFKKSDLSKSTKSPSKYTSWKRLEQIKQDHGRLSSGDEHHQDELGQAIIDAKVRDAEKMVRDADRMQQRPMRKGQNGNWQEEGVKFFHEPGKIFELNGKPDSQFHTIKAVDQDGNVVARFDFDHVQDPTMGEHINVRSASVHPLSRRTGIASEAYRQIESITGAKIRSSPSNQSDDAKALWSNPNRVFGKSELKKDAPKFRLPRIKNINNRPDQEIHQVPSYSTQSRDHTREMQARLAANRLGIPEKGADVDRRVAAHAKRLDTHKRALSQVDQTGQGFGPTGGFVSRNFHRPEHQIGFASQDHDESRHITEHEGHHHLFNQVESKYGRPAREKVVNHILSHFHPDDVNAMANAFKGSSYKADHPDFKEEVANKLRDLVAKPSNRANASQIKGLDLQRVKAGLKNASKSLKSVDENWLKSGMDDDFDLEYQQNQFRAKNLNSGKLAASELKKSRSRFAFPKFKKLTNRPDQEIQSVDTDRQAKIFSKKVTNTVRDNEFFADPSLPKYKQKSIQDHLRGNAAREIYNSTKYDMDPERVSSEKGVFDSMGKDVPTEVLGASGAVVGTSGKRSFGRVTGESKNPSGTRRDHEAIHYLFNDMELKYGKDVSDHAKGHVESLIHPDVHSVLNEYLLQTGYSSTDGEIVTHLHEMLHDPNTRKAIGQFSPEFASKERDIMNKAKKSWDAVTDFANNLEEPK